MWLCACCETTTDDLQLCVPAIGHRTSWIRQTVQAVFQTQGPTLFGSLQVGTRSKSKKQHIFHQLLLSPRKKKLVNLTAWLIYGIMARM